MDDLIVAVARTTMLAILKVNKHILKDFLKSAGPAQLEQLYLNY